MFHVGQLVVCAYKFTSPNTYGEAYPRKGGVYTVRAITPGVMFKGCNVYLLLEEIVNPQQEYAEGIYECQFWSRRFRPVKVNESSIEIFRELVKTAPRETVDG